MNIINLLFSWDWCKGLQPVLHLIKEVLNIVRIVVPIALIAMTTLDITKNVINPDDKDGQKKIMTRAIAALIVFLVPTFIKLTFIVIDWGSNSSGTYDDNVSALSRCWG